MFELNLQRAVLKDRYEIKSAIRSGSYAEVFVARDRESGNAWSKRGVPELLGLSGLRYISSFGSRWHRILRERAPA